MALTQASFYFMSDLSLASHPAVAVFTLCPIWFPPYVLSISLLTSCLIFTRASTIAIIYQRPDLCDLSSTHRTSFPSSLYLLGPMNTHTTPTPLAWISWTILSGIHAVFFWFALAMFGFLAFCSCKSGFLRVLHPTWYGMIVVVKYGDPAASEHRNRICW